MSSTRVAKARPASKAGGKARQPKPRAAKGNGASGDPTTRVGREVTRALHDAYVVLNRIQRLSGAAGANMQATVDATTQVLALVTLRAARYLAHCAESRQSPSAIGASGYHDLGRYDREAAHNMIEFGVAVLAGVELAGDDLAVLRNFARYAHGGRSAGNDPAQAARYRNVAEVLELWLAPQVMPSWQMNPAMLARGLLLKLAECGLEQLPSEADLTRWLGRYTPGKSTHGKLTRTGLVANIVHGETSDVAVQRDRVKRVQEAL